MEPMTLGSPNTSHNASVFDNSVSNSQFLPSFLLGSDSGSPSPYTSPKSFSSNKSQFTKYPTSPQYTSVAERNTIPNQISTVEKHDGPPIISLSDYNDYNSIRSMNQSSLNHDFNVTQNNSRDCLVEDFSDNWVTIFGFAPSQIDFVLSYFIRYGQIIDKKHSSNGGNWIHVKYSNRREALSALSQNGKQISPSLMIGVLLRKEKHSVENVTNRSLTFQTQLDSTIQRPSVVSPPFSPTIRRLTVTNNENEVVPLSNVPTKSSGVVSKTMEYLFGW